MMRLRSFFRDLALLCLAVSLGWWLHSANTPVLAEHSGAPSDLAFQIIGSGPDTSLSLYNPADHKLYVYPRITQGNSYVSCGYSLAVTRPGAPIQRENCAIGPLMPPH